MDVRSLPAVGFEFLQSYFISLNEREGVLERVSTASQSASRGSAYSTYQGPAGRWTNNNTTNASPWASASAQRGEESSGSSGARPAVSLLKLPSELKELGMLWTLVLECEGGSVVTSAIDFLVAVHLSLKDDLEDSKGQVLRAFVSRCMSIIQEAKGKDSKRCERVVQVLQSFVQATEVKGTAGVLPHGALLGGEALDPLRVRNRTTPAGGEMIVQVHSHNTLWDLRCQVAAAVELAPRHL